MTLEEYTSRIETDPAYRQYITTHAFAGTLPPDEELLLLESALGPPKPVRLTPLQALRLRMAQDFPDKYPPPLPRTSPRPRTPWFCSLFVIVRAYRARPGYVAPERLIDEVVAIRNEVQLHREKWRHLRCQLYDSLQALDDAFPEAKDLWERTFR